MPCSFVDYKISSLPGQNGRLVVDDSSKGIFTNEKFFVTIFRISLKFVPKGPVDNKAALVRSGNGLAPDKRHAITGTSADPVHRRIYAALGEDELRYTVNIQKISPFV